MRIFYRILYYLIIPLGIVFAIVKGLNNFPVVVTCTIKEYTGLDCPGCGGQRAVASLLHGKFKEAFYYNPLIYFYLGVFIYIYVLFVETYGLKNKEFMRKLGFSKRFPLFFILVIGLFFIIRNI
ncbi:DUF2752 domain-containing protein [Myroides odoratus]|uniref:DUF2752 domain-containing protein n=1 Tax=Myroides odoratus TaxID=256 RepID=UPI0039AF2370